MIDIIMRGIVSNAKNIENIADHIKKVDKTNAITFFLITGCMYCITKTISVQKNRIDILEKKVESIETKGE